MHQVVRYASETAFRVGFCPKKSLGHAEAHRIIQYPTEKGKRKVKRTALGSSGPPAIPACGIS
jgi:hypothetical protein